MPSTEGSRDQVVADIRKEFPDFKIVSKNDSRFMRFMDVLVRIVTFGQMKRFMVMNTTVGHTVYTSTDWDDDPESHKIEVLLHERIHLRQQKRYGKLLFAFLYTFFPLPFFFAYFRTKFEQEAYAESMRYKASIEGIRALERDDYRQRMVDRFTSATYGWMWYSKNDIEIWFSQVVIDLHLKGFSVRPPPS